MLLKNRGRRQILSQTMKSFMMIIRSDYFLQFVIISYNLRFLISPITQSCVLKSDFNLSEVFKKDNSTFMPMKREK